MNKAYEELQPLMEKAMALKSALILFEWDNETLAPEASGSNSAKIVGALSAEYYNAIAAPCLGKLLEECVGDASLSEEEQAVVRETKEERDQIVSIPGEEYRANAQLVSEATRVWSKAKKQKDFEAFIPTLQKIIDYQKKFASYRQKEGQKLYDVMLDAFEPGFTMELLDEFFGRLKEELVPLLKSVMENGKEIDDSFLTGDYPVEDQKALAEFIAEYVGFDFDKGVLAVSAHPFTTNLHNKDVRITTHYSNHMDSSLFSVIHEAGHGIYEMGIRDSLTLTYAGQGASMGMHESQSRFFENIVGRNLAFWVPVFDQVKKIFPEQLGCVTLEQFTSAVNKVEPGLIRTEADELTYSLHILIRYEIEKMIVEEDLDVTRLPEIWADKYEQYLGIRPKDVAEGVLQDIHWSQGSFGYFPSYALGSAFGAQLYYHMKESMDFEGLLEAGKVSVIREYLKEHIHQYGKMKNSRQILKDTTGEDFSTKYYIRYLKEKFTELYQL